MNNDYKIQYWNPLTIELKNLLYDNVKTEELTINEILNKYKDFLTDEQKEILISYKKFSHE